MTDKLEEQLAEGIERAQHISSQVSAIRDYKGSGSSIEAKLSEIERLIREIRQVSANVKGMLG